MLSSADERDHLRGFIESCQRLIGKYALGEFGENHLISLISRDTPPIRSKLARLVVEGIRSDIKDRLEAGPQVRHNGAEVASSSDRRVDLAMLFIRQHFHDSELRIGHAAKQIGISASRLEHLVTKETGASWGVHVRTTRLQNAVRLLVQTSLSIKQVAAAVGYRYVSSLDRDFRTRYHSRPSDVRHSRRLPERALPRRVT